MKLKLLKPLAFTDLETTGTSVTKDRIVQIAVVIVFPDGRRDKYVTLINPEMPIPATATAVHHITDEMVKDAPKFRDIAGWLYNHLSPCDLGGYNSNRFDIPMLAEEFERCGIEFPIEGQVFVDAQVIFHGMEKRTLGAAYKFYVDPEKDLENAHDALVDTEATVDVFFNQVRIYEDLSEMESISQIVNFFKKEERLDLAGKFIRNEEGIELFNFGKHRGKTVSEGMLDKGYYTWMIGDKSDLSSNSKAVAKRLYDQVQQLNRK